MKRANIGCAAVGLTAAVAAVLLAQALPNNPVFSNVVLLICLVLTASILIPVALSGLAPYVARTGWLLAEEQHAERVQRRERAARQRNRLPRRGEREAEREEERARLADDEARLAEKHRRQAAADRAAWEAEQRSAPPSEWVEPSRWADKPPAADTRVRSSHAGRRDPNEAPETTLMMPTYTEQPYNAYGVGEPEASLYARNASAEAAG